MYPQTCHLQMSGTQISLLGFSTASYSQVAKIGHCYFTLSAHSLNCCTCSDLPVSFVELLTLSSFYPRYCLTVLVDFGYQEMYECMLCAYYPESSLLALWVH
jgi:hypothetical protein